MNTQENNKLIAEFMGGEYVDEYLIEFKNFYSVKEIIEGEFVKTNCFDSDNELQYHTSWDWLMPVVEKIESLGYEFFIVEDRVKIAHNTDHSTETIIDFTLGGSKRDATYKAVVEFINQLNK